MRFIRHIVALLAILTVCACTNNEEQEFDIHGAWVLKSIHVSDGEDYNYYEGSKVPVKIFADTVYYVAQKISDSNQFAFTPSYSGRYKLINKGGQEWLYLEDGNVHEFMVVNDSTINITDVGRVYEWHRMSDKASANDIISVTKQGRQAWDENRQTYLITTTERNLKTDRSYLITGILCIILAFILMVYYTRNLYRNKARMEAQLKQIREEQDSRPTVVQEALKTVEEEFLHSDFYHSIRKRISNGEHLKKADWDEIEHQVNTTYNSFTNRLLNLYPMSQLEMHTCLLIKLRIPTTEIANTLMKETSTISSLRSRLYAKVFHKKGGAKEWNDFILSL